MRRNARLCELLDAALSSLTREGYLYRVDLRLRPVARMGAGYKFRRLPRVLEAAAAPLGMAGYVKLRAVAGDLELGR